MNPDRNVQISLTLLDELQSANSPVRRLLVASVQGKSSQVSFQSLPENVSGYTQPGFHARSKFMGLAVGIHMFSTLGTNTGIDVFSK